MFTFNYKKSLGVFSSCSCEREAYYAAWRHNMTGPGAVSHRDSNPGMIRTENQGTLLWVQHYHQGVASITGRVGERNERFRIPGFAPLCGTAPGPDMPSPPRRFAITIGAEMYKCVTVWGMKCIIRNLICGCLQMENKQFVITAVILACI